MPYGVYSSEWVYTVGVFWWYHSFQFHGWLKVLFHAKVTLYGNQAIKSSCTKNLLDTYYGALQFEWKEV